MVSRIESPGLSGVRAIPAWTTFGMGTRAEYLLTRNVSATLDMTSSFLGGPAITNTAELGTRLHPEWAEHKFYPFVDLRVGYLTAYDRGLGAYDNIYADPTLPRPTIRYSRGFGAIGGAGVEYAITRTWTATTSASVLRSEMTARDFEVAPPHTQFGLTSFRYTLGVRYNPVRLMRSPGASH
jgi:outer membrane protein W